ncbi:SLC13 family permease [Candidiatus Paracoxiella cheracis]|uniref:SLC13 family permease n=1 Tax=Candidiatus Paracoxiella cheracis TaxID=3405120 RepID=UPI003BF5C77B
MHGPYTILIVLAITMALFIWGYWRYDVVAMIALLISTAVGAVPYDRVFTGFSNPAVITVACVMIISQAITRSGIMSSLVRKIIHFTKNPTLHIGGLTLLTAIFSAFMNNVGALALMMPIAIQTAIKNNRSPSTILMPIALGSAMGGLTTLIGTPPNLLISSYREQITGQPFTIFAFAHVGFFVAVAGVLFIALIGWRLLPKKRKAPKQADDMFQMQDYITEIKIPENSPTVGITVRELEKMVEGDFVITGLIRNKKKKLIIPPDHVLEADDILIIESSTTDLEELLQTAKLELVGGEKISSDILKSKDVSLIEAVVPPGSRIENRSSQNIHLRSRYRINLLAISREGNPFKERLHQVNLRAGDVVLLQGPVDILQENVANLGFLPLIERRLDVGKRRAFVPLFIFVLAIILTALQLIPVEIAFGGAVLAMILFRSIPLRFVYDSIEWPVIILLAAMIPIGEALQSTGGTALIAHDIIGLTQHLPPVYILGLLLIVTMTISDFMNNAATAVVMAPIAGTIAHTMHASIDPFLMVVAIGASCSFLTPIGHQNNTLVMGPGGYKFIDYIRLGLPLEIIVIVVALPLIQWAWPL